VSRQVSCRLARMPCAGIADRRGDLPCGLPNRLRVVVSGSFRVDQHRGPTDVPGRDCPRVLLSVSIASLDDVRSEIAALKQSGGTGHGF